MVFTASGFPRLVFAVALATVFSVGCASHRMRSTATSQDGCALIDSTFLLAGFSEPLVFVGKATVDANQYRVRGVVRLETQPPGDVFLEFNTSMLFGNHVEDFFCSVVDDTLRIVDRERGNFFEGPVAEEFLRDQLSMDFGIRSALGLVLGRRPSCDALEQVEIRPRSGGQVMTGRASGDAFRVEFGSSGRVTRVEWPVPDDPELGDRLRVEYDWAEEGQSLERMTIYLEGREWRCRLIATTD